MHEKALSLESRSPGKRQHQCQEAGFRKWGGDIDYEENYRQLNKEFRILLKGIPDLLFHVDRELDVIWMNEAASQQRTRCFPSAHAVAETVRLYQFWFAEPNDYAFNAIHRAFDTGQQQEEVFEDCRQRSWGLKVFPPIQESSGEQTALIMASDITEKLQLRSEALRTGQMAMLGHIAAGVAHEINNPINGIINYAQLVVDRCAADKEAESLSREIIREGTRIAGIVSNLLAFAGGQQEPASDIPGDGLIRDALQLAGAQLAGDDIRLELDLAETLPSLKGHKAQLQQMILNLLSNARNALNRKFKDRKGEKTLVIRAQPVDNGTRSMIRYQFVDNGIGIRSCDLEKIFDPFYTTAAATGGKGLGLSVSRGIARSHGGEIRLDSEFGRFTRVEVDLPVNDSSREDDF